LTVPSVGENGEQQELPWTAGSRVNWPNHFGNVWQILTNVETYIYPQLSNSTSKQVSNRDKNTCIQKYIEKYILSIIHNNLKVETTCVNRMHRVRCCSVKRTWANLLHVIIWMNVINMMIKETSQQKCAVWFPV